MISWHGENCRKPDVSLAGVLPYCGRCDRTANVSLDTFQPPQPRMIPHSPQSDLHLSWPACVPYSEKCVLGKDDDEDLGPIIREKLQFETSFSNSQNDDGQAQELSMWEDETLGFDTLNAPNQIRLLRLMGGHLDDPLHGILVTASLDQRLDFEAVSYVWAGEDGNDIRSHVLFMGDSWDILPITDNCAAALRRLRFPNRERTLWIDAVCIDQSNNFERSHQVSLMKEIYSSSRRCLVYLGEHTEDSPKAMQLINAGVPPELLPDEHSALTALFLRKYFFRTWIFQELVLSRTVLVLCGDSTADWSKFYSKNWDSYSPEVHVPAWIQNFELARYQQALDFPRCIFETADLVSSDDRDKIFAIMGLFEGLDTDGLVPDYELSVEQVYTGIAAHLLDQHRMFHILTLQSTKHEDLPSWVPDWKSVRPSQWDSHQQVSEELLQKLPNNFDVSSSNIDKHFFWHELGVMKKTFEDDTKDKHQFSVTISDLGTEKYEAMRTVRPGHIDLNPVIHKGTGSLSITSEFLLPLKSFTSSNHFPWAAQTPFHGQLADESHWLVISTQSINVETDFVAVFPGNRLFLHLRKIASPAIFRIIGHCNIVIATVRHSGRKSVDYRNPKTKKECHADIAAILLVAPDQLSSDRRNALPDIVGVWASQVWAPALWDAYHWMSENIDPKRRPSEKNEETLSEAYEVYLGRLQEPLEFRNRNLLQCIDFWSYKDPWELLEKCGPIGRTFMCHEIMHHWKTWQWHKERFIRDMDSPNLSLLDRHVDNLLQSTEDIKSKALYLMNSQTEIAKERIYCDSLPDEPNQSRPPWTAGKQIGAINNDDEHDENEIEGKLAPLKLQVEECLTRIVTKRMSLQDKINQLRGSGLWSAKWDKESHMPTEEFLLLIQELNDLLQRRHDLLVEDLETTWVSMYQRDLEELRHPGSATLFTKFTMQLSSSNLTARTIKIHCGELGAALNMKLKMTEGDRIVIV